MGTVKNFNPSQPTRVASWLKSNAKLSLMLLALGSIQFSNTLQAEPLQLNSQLQAAAPAPAEQSDANIAFTLPDGFKCNPAEFPVNGKNVPSFAIANASGSAFYMLYSQAGVQKSDFDAHWQNAKTAFFPSMKIEDEENTTIKIGTRDCLYRMGSVTMGGTKICLRIYMLLDSKTGKACVITNSDAGNADDSQKKILQNVRFK